MNALLELAVAVGLPGPAVQVAVLKSGPDERYDLMMRLPGESAVEVSVKSHQTPEFSA